MFRSPPPAPAPAVPAAAAQALPGAETLACTLKSAPTPVALGAGTVYGFENRSISLARIQLTEQTVGGKIDPDYVDNLRVDVHLDSGRDIVFLVPKALAVRVGDRVTVQGGYRNAALPCNYIPNLITADLGPAPPRSVAAPTQTSGGQQ